MASSCLLKPPSSPHLHGRSSSISLHPSPAYVMLPFVFHRKSFNLHVCSLKTGSDGSDLGRKLIVPPASELGEEEEDSYGRGNYKEEEEGGLDWEDQILADVAPLVGFVRTILHSGRYGSGDRLSPEHERTIIERVLRYHPDCDKKIGSGIDYITVGYHPDFETARCLFVVRKDGQLVDFSYWKCIKAMIRKNYPLYGESFILRHFRR